MFETETRLRLERDSDSHVYTLTVNGVRDGYGSFISPDSRTRFQAWDILPGSIPPLMLPPALHIRRSGADLVVDWPEGSQLQQADRITGPWETLPVAAHPYVVSSTNSMRWFRALF